MKNEEIKRDGYGHVIYKRICECCGEVFWARRKDKKFCLNACRTMKWRLSTKVK